MNNEKIETCSMLLAIGTLDPNNKEVFDENNGMHQILQKRLTACGIETKVPCWLTEIIAVCTDGVPGYALMLFKEFLCKLNKNKFNGKGIEPTYEIEPLDFGLAYPDGFPIDNKKYENMFDSQKRENVYGSVNLCDTLEYWQKEFKLSR